MTLEELQHIFRHQTTPGVDYEPSGRVEYILFEGRNQTASSHNASDLASLLPLLEGYVFEGYRDRTVLFIKPETDL